MKLSKKLNKIKENDFKKIDKKSLIKSIKEKIKILEGDKMILK